MFELFFFSSKVCIMPNRYCMLKFINFASDAKWLVTGVKWNNMHIVPVSTAWLLLRLWMEKRPPVWRNGDKSRRSQELAVYNCSFNPLT
jgi:hypothetical protein